CRVKPGSDGRSLSIAAIGLAQAVLHRPARLAAVPRSVAARAIVHGFPRVAWRSTVIRAWPRAVRPRGLVGGRRVIRRGRRVGWNRGRGGVVGWGRVVGRGAIVGWWGGVRIGADAEIECLRRCRAGRGEHGRERNCCDLGHSGSPSMKRLLWNRHLTTR